ncbi:hypothetical protein MVEN_00042900 [Mycena venus]|uniref:Uncharacterized protein n=1 Tax=Mycena venus TaxID=2733690 RepID=A0A8H7DDV5_9AGAR|nr:hypothetical protein MVEN_00042900 [Mycena venus]
MPLTCEDDYKTLLEEVHKKTAPETVKICFSELKVVDGDDDDSTSEEKEQHPKKGKKAKIINMDGRAVNLDNPPDDKLFEFQEAENEEDQQLLRSHATEKATVKDSNITINLTLPKPMQPLQPQEQQRINAPATLPRRCYLEIFVDHYNLTNPVYQKLQDFSVTGPHTLRHLKNEHLLEAGLNHAEVANVRDVQDGLVIGEGGP